MAPTHLARRLLLRAGRPTDAAWRCVPHATGGHSTATSSNDDSHAPPTASGRPYCSHAPHADEMEQLRGRLLDVALKHVGTRGWSAGALVAAARELELSPAVTGLLPRGEAELVEHFMRACNSRCLTDLAARQEEFRALPLEERVAAALQARLQLIAPVIDSWPQALAVAARPANAPHSLKLLFGLVDDIWHAVGDDTTDASWYSRRTLLAGVYSATSLYMLTDYSPGFRETWQALQRRVAESIALDASVQHALRAVSAATAGGPTQQQAAATATAEAQAAATTQQEAPGTLHGNGAAAAPQGAQAPAGG